MREAIAGDCDGDRGPRIVVGLGRFGANDASTTDDGARAGAGSRPWIDTIRMPARSPAAIAADPGTTAVTTIRRVCAL